MGLIQIKPKDANGLWQWFMAVMPRFPFHSSSFAHAKNFVEICQSDYTVFVN